MFREWAFSWNFTVCKKAKQRKMCKTDAKELIALTLCQGFQPLPSWGGAIRHFCQSIRGPLTIKNHCFKQFPINYARPLFVQFLSNLCGWL